jgi:hypothetical protein
MRKIFVAYGYNPRDKWVEELVFPIIEAFGVEVVTGGEVWGGQIPPEVETRIRESFGLIAFATRRERIRTGSYTTHRWVTDELACAVALARPVIEVRETEVDGQGGIAGDRQRITYDANARDKCLVELTRAIGRWCQGLSVSLQLRPQAAVDKIRALRNEPGFRCMYTLRQGGQSSGPQPVDLVPFKGGLFIDLMNVPRQSLVQIRVEGAGTVWTSDFESPESLNIELTQE